MTLLIIDSVLQRPLSYICDNILSLNFIMNRKKAYFMEKVMLEAEKVMTINAICPQEERLCVGQNDYGFLRAICITGGWFEGEKLKGKVVPGGADWNTGFGGNEPDSFTSSDMFAKYLLQTDDGVYIAVENRARRNKKMETPNIMTRPTFFAPKGKYEFLNYGVYVAALRSVDINGVSGVEITVYQMK